MRNGAREMGMHGHSGGGVFEMLGSLISVMFLLGVLAMILWAASRLLFVRSSGGGANGAADVAENILRERFARGEIPAEEYEKSLETLRASAREASSGNPPGDAPPRGRYESYVRDAIERLKPRRGGNS